MPLKLVALALGIAFSSTAVAGTSCLWGEPGTYPAEELDAAAKEKIDYVREQLRTLPNLEFASSKARVLKSLPEWLPLVFAEDAEGDQLCHVEFAAYLSELVFAAELVEFTPFLLGAIEAMGNLADYRTVMQAKGDFLIRLLLADETAFTTWRGGDPWQGPRIDPDVSTVRLLVAAQLAKSNLLLNHAGYVDMLTNTASVSTSYELRDALQPELTKLLDYFRWTRQPDRATKVLTHWLSEAAALLQQNVSSVYPYYAVLATIEALGSFAPGFGLEAEARAFLEDVVAKEGHFPMSEDVYEGPQQLLRAARRALIFR